MLIKLVLSLTILMGHLFVPMLHASDDLAVKDQYQLASGDVIRVSVFGEDDLSFDSIRLNESGAFSYPFIGVVNAMGLTARQLEQRIFNGLKDDYLINPRISVSVLEYRQFYISGEVRKPGGYSYQPGLTVRRALAIAGGMTDRGSERRISIIRDGRSTDQSERATLDTLVMPGDSIQINQGFF